ncbi:MAG TPA: chemotaxis protein CheB [Puia sp.]|nr:chemotaxis protein CheB [Puia sp.]
MKPDKLVVIGGSAGSLHIVFSILSAIGKDYPFPVMLVLHRNNNVESSLEELISGRTLLTIKEVEEKEVLRAGTVYVCPADYHVLVEQDHTTSLDYSERVNYSRPSIDVTFRSAAEVYGPDLIAVLLSGGNSDGADGMENVKAMGGFTILQDPKTAEVPYMPQQVMLRMTVDVVAPDAELPLLIRRLGET